MKLRLLIAMGALVIALSLVACARTEERHADGTKWVTSEQQFEYQRERSGTVRVGEYRVPTYDNEWQSVEYVEKTGTDREPVAPNELTCTTEVPASPKFGDVYCTTLPTRYYIIFGDDAVEVTFEEWYAHSPGKIYTTRSVLGKIEIVSNQ